MYKFAIATLAVIALTATTQAQTFYASTDKFGYTGTMTKYASLADAQTNSNAISNHTFAQRDGALYVLKNASTFDNLTPNANVFMTAWYYTTDQDHGQYSGWGNPNNNTDSFAQLYDADGSTTVTKSGGWTSNAYDTFNVSVSGVNADYANDYSRLWNGKAAGAGEPTHGGFVNYSLNMTATGLNGLEIAPGFFESSNHPTSVSGSFSGIFENLSTTDPSSNGFYSFNLTFNNTNWAYAQGDALNGSFSPSRFGAAAVPEPATMALIACSAAAYVRRRLKK